MQKRKTPPYHQPIPVSNKFILLKEALTHVLAICFLNVCTFSLYKIPAFRHSAQPYPPKILILTSLS